jgi:hypothetical protein
VPNRALGHSNLSQQDWRNVISAHRTLENPKAVISSEISNLRDGRITPEVVFRDPHLLDFLGLKGAFSENDLEVAILREIEGVLLELETGFAFVRAPAEESPLGLILCASADAEQVELLRLNAKSIRVGIARVASPRLLATMSYAALSR